MPESISPESIKRRQLLSGLMKLLIFIGLVFISIPFISSFSSNSIDEKQRSKNNWVITQAVSSLTQGQVNILNWTGGTVWVYHRTNDDIQLLKETAASLRDSLSTQSDQPEKMQNHFRSADEAYFVFIPYENKRSCQVTLVNEAGAARFTEPCYGAKYDAAGRIFENTGHLEQQNLAVPMHVIEDGVLKIGVWIPKI